MNKKANIKIIKLFARVLLSSMALISALCLAADDPVIEPQESKHETQTNSAPNPHIISFQTFPENDQDNKLFELLESSNTYTRILDTIESNFIVETPVRFHIQHTKEAQFIATEIKVNTHIIRLPISFLHTLYQGLANKYAYQTEVIDQIFQATFEFYIWSEFAQHLIQEKRLEVQGDTFTARDNLATIMLLNQNNHSSDYLADASEAFLLIDNSRASAISQFSQSELELDQMRYRHIICLTIGFNRSTQEANTENDHLSSFSLDKADVERCKTSYQDIVENWYLALEPFLKKGNTLSHWLNQSASSETSLPLFSPYQ